MTGGLPDEELESRHRTWLVAGAIALSVMLVGVGIGLALLAHRPTTAGTVSRRMEDREASETTSAASLSESGEPTGTRQNPTSTTTVVPQSHGAAHPGTIVRSPKIAFRLGNEIYVSNEDGSSAKAVYRSQSGAFSLAPDASMLAVAPSAGGSPGVLVDVSTLRSVAVTGAVDLPTWAADSSWVAYTSRDASGTYSVRRVGRDGIGDALLVKPGASPAISPDGNHVAFVRTNQAAGDDALAVVGVAKRDVTMLPKVSGRSIAKANGSLDYAWSPSGILYFAQAGGTAGSGYLAALDASLKHAAQLASLPTTPSGLAPDDIEFSPDGKRIVFTENGDDGYSRLLVMDVANGKVTSLPTRRDAYPMRWTSDGKAVIYVEGNVIQEEKTSLYRINPDGTRRLMIVSGAGL